MNTLDITIRNANFTPVAILDQFSSAIWTERFSDCGDFEIEIPANSQFLSYMAIGNILTLKGSDTVMIVESISLKTEGKASTLKVKGRSIDSILERRIVWGQMNLSGALGNQVNRLIRANLTNPVIGDVSAPQRKIEGWYFRIPTGELGSQEIECQFTGDTLRDAIKSICDVYGAGIRVVRANNRFEIELYLGTDRTISQFNYEPVIFSPEYDTLISSEYYQDYQKYKNVALVMGEDSGANRKRETVYYEDSEPSGLERREMYVDAKDIQSETDSGTSMSDTEYRQRLIYRGLSKLLDKENAVSTAFDGEIETKIGPEFGVDYFLGDYVSTLNEYGFGSTAQITEFIRSYDTNGYSEYPTFTMIN
jgi:hypothetical protein